MTACDENLLLATEELHMAMEQSNMAMCFFFQLALSIICILLVRHNKI